MKNRFCYRCHWRRYGDDAFVWPAKDATWAVLAQSITWVCPLEIIKVKWSRPAAKYIVGKVFELNNFLKKWL